MQLLQDSLPLLTMLVEERPVDVTSGFNSTSCTLTNVFFNDPIPVESIPSSNSFSL